MSFIRSRCTGAGVNVYAMIQNLTALAPGKYYELLDRFKAIQEEIQGSWAADAITGDGRLVLPLDEVNLSRLDEAGGKMASLGHVAQTLGAKVPPGFVITTGAYGLFLSTTGFRRR